MEWVSEIEKIKAIPYPMQVDISAGDIGRFAAAIDIEVGFNEPSRDLSALTFGGIPVRKSDLLPANMAAMLVNGQLVQLYKFD
jgi:hypothetical protein